MNSVPIPVNAQEILEVEQGFLDLSARYSRLKIDCESRVVSWHWASNSLHELRPMYMEVHGMKRGRYLSKPPKNQGNKLEYGLDESGVVHVAREHIRFSGYPERLWFKETFYVYADGRTEVAHFDYFTGKEPIFFAIGNYVGSELVQWRTRARAGASRERYLWEDGKPVRIVVERAAVDCNGKCAPLVYSHRYDIKHDAAGVAQEIVWRRASTVGHPDDQTRVVYRRLPLGVKLEDLVSKMQSVVTAAIVDRISRVNIVEPVYSLVLTWSPGQQESLPPSIGIGLQREREAWIREFGAKAGSMMWNPAEYQNFFSIESREVDEACRSLNQECSLTDSWTKVSKSLNQIAKELGQRDWGDALQTTDDFVCYAVNLELTDIRRNLDFSAPQDLLKAFGDKGWLSNVS